MKNLSKEMVNLFWVQFLGALNDNIFKNALVIMITYQGITIFNLNSKMLVALAGGIFILPFFLFSAISGDLSHKFDRIMIVRWVKIIEVIIMILASMGIFLQNYYLLFIVLFMLGTHSTFFGPIKYSLIPEYTEEDKIVFSNALVSAGTFVAILLGTILGGILANQIKFTWLLKFVLIIFSILGIYFSFQLPALEPDEKNKKVNWNIVSSNKNILKIIFQDKEIFSLLFGLSWFWFLGAGILSLIPGVALEIFKAKESVATCMLFTFTLGMGLGPFVLDRVTKGKIYKSLIPISLFLMSLFIFDVAYVLKQFLNGNFLPPIFESINLNQFLSLKFSMRFLFDLFCISFLGGIFTVLQFSELQLSVEKSSLSKVIAGNNILNAIFMVTVSLLIMFLHQMDLGHHVIFAIIGILNIGTGVVLSFFHREEFERYWSF